jgi:aspartate kinase
MGKNCLVPAGKGIVWPMGLIVQKYGGSTVASIDKIKSVADHIKTCINDGHQLIVTISAMGSRTDELMSLALEMSDSPPRRELDMLLTAGERVSMALLSIALHDRGVDSVSLTGSQCGILTDQTHGNARITKILGDRIRAGIKKNKVVIVAGFQGVSPVTKEVTTLGRGGTDLSAIALTAALKADQCQLFKDVNGLMSADPRLVKNAVHLPQVSWQTMNEMAWHGANVLHPRGAHLAKKYEIPFEIRSSSNFSSPGTTVKGSKKMEKPQVNSIAHLDEMNLIGLIISGTPGSAVLSKGIAWLWEKGEAPILNTQIQIGEKKTYLTQLLPESLTADFITYVRETANAQGGECTEDTIISDLSCITIIGEGFQQSPEILEKVGETITSENSEPIMIDTRNTAISICVKKECLDKVINALHKTFLT